MIQGETNDWRILFENDRESFCNRFFLDINNGNVAELEYALEVLLGHFFYIYENQRITELEELSDILKKIQDELIFQRTLIPGMYVIRGSVDTIIKMIDYLMLSVPDFEWNFELKGKYDKPIIEYLYMKNADRMTNIAEYIDVQGPQLTLIIERLENADFLRRDKEGKNVWVSLTKKGFKMGKAIFQEHYKQPLIRLIQELTFYSIKQKDEAEIEAMLKKYSDKYPEMLSIVYSLKELWKVKVIQQWYHFRPYDWNDVIEVKNLDQNVEIGSKLVKKRAPKHIESREILL